MNSSYCLHRTKQFISGGWGRTDLPQVVHEVGDCESFNGASRNLIRSSCKLDVFGNGVESALFFIRIISNRKSNELLLTEIRREEFGIFTLRSYP